MEIFLLWMRCALFVASRRNWQFEHQRILLAPLVKPWKQRLPQNTSHVYARISSAALLQ